LAMSSFGGDPPRSRQRSDTWEHYVQPVIRDGHLPISTMREYFNSSQMVEELMKLNEHTLSHIRNTPSQMEQLRGALSGDRLELATAIINQGRANVEDRLRAIYLGILPKEKLDETLAMLQTTDQRRAAADNYS